MTESSMISRYLLVELTTAKARTWIVVTSIISYCIILRMADEISFPVSGIVIFLC